MRPLFIFPLLLLTGTALATDPLIELADDPSPIRQAARAGVNYRPTVARAQHGDTSALASLFELTGGHMDGMGMTLHCSVLRLLMESLGDQRFARTLRKRSPKIRNAVLEALDFAFAHPWKMQFPLTYSLGVHNARLLNQRKNT